jgi:lactate dehydrogenase-like 2-hydroxyacid dehydrogenase
VHARANQFSWGPILEVAKLFAGIFVTIVPVIAISKPSILVARAVFPETIARLERHFEVDSNQSDALWSKQDLVARLQGKAGVFTTGGERIDADVLSACPQLRICANMAVGYNNFDLPAMTAAKVLGTNTPDVLTETTADFGFALLMATARRVTESEHYLRAGKWTKWASTCSPAPTCTAARWASWAWAASARASRAAARMASACA